MHDNMNITALLAGLSARNGDRPKYLALADAVEQAFREHELPPGTALPPQRALARALGVTLGTVSRAYAEAATRGLVEASVGRGTFIRVQRPDVDVMPPEAAEGGEAAPDAPHCLPTKRPAADAGNHAVLRAKPALHNLGFIAPFEHLNPSLSQGLRKLTEHDAAMLDGLQSYRRPGGMLRHREAGALWAGRYGLAARPADLLICAGSQHALLTILTSLCAPGDRIAAESLSYPLLRQLARRLRIQIVPVRADAGGMSPDALDSACRGAPPGNRVRAVYLMPSCRNPTLTRMSLRRREEIVEVCRRHDLLIMEDDVFALAHSRDDAPDKGSRLPPLALRNAPASSPPPAKCWAEGCAWPTSARLSITWKSWKKPFPIPFPWFPRSWRNWPRAGSATARRSTSLRPSGPRPLRAAFSRAIFWTVLN